MRGIGERESTGVTAKRSISPRFSRSLILAAPALVAVNVIGRAPPHQARGLAALDRSLAPFGRSASMMGIWPPSRLNPPLGRPAR